MKKRISVDQMRELTKEQKKKLCEWWHPEHGDNFYDYIETAYTDCIVFLNGNDIKGCQGDEYKKENCLPLLNIGQMIELLENKEHNNHLIRQIFHITSSQIDNVDNLCDALWEAIKSIL